MSKPQLPVFSSTFEGGHDASKRLQPLQLCDGVPATVWQPAGTRVLRSIVFIKNLQKEPQSVKQNRLCWKVGTLWIGASAVVSYRFLSKEEGILVLVQFSGHLQDFDAHLEAEGQLVSLKQTPACVAAAEKDGVKFVKCLLLKEM